MKDQPNRITYKQFLKMLRPNLRPSLASKDFYQLLCSMKRTEFLDTVNCVALSRLNRIAEIQEEPERYKDELDAFWKARGSSLDEIEKQVREKAREEQAHKKENGLHKGTANFLKSEYDKWRPAETARQRATAARVKAQKQAKAKAEGERIKNEKKEARRTKPYITKRADVEKELDRKSYNDYLAR